MFLGTIAHVYEPNSFIITAPATYYSQWPYSFAGWTDDLSGSNSRTLTPTGNTTLTSLYKYANHSNSANAYASSSQRKFVRTPDGTLHKVYESMGHVWYETSTNGGS